MSLGWDILIIFLVSVVILCLDFKHPIHFISTGYGASVLVQSIVIIILHITDLFKGGKYFSAILVIVHAVLIVFYGYRLASFLYKRSKNENYQATLKPFTLSPALSVIILVTCSALYLFMVSPLLQHALLVVNGVSPCQIIGMIVMICGLYIEALADHQKSEAKKINPKEFCSSGLYKYLRMPNYFGELVFWFGNYITSWFVNQHWYFIAFNLIGFLCIGFIMFHSASRLDIKQRQRYGTNPKFIEYRKTTRILIPLIPLYEINIVKDTEA